MWNLFGDNVIENTNSDVNGDLTPGNGNQQTLIQRSLPSDLQPGEMVYQYSSDEFENNLHGMSAQTSAAQVPNTNLPSNATWTTVNTTSVGSDPGYLDFGSPGVSNGSPGSAANSVYWASSWVWVPPETSGWNWQDPETLSETWGDFTYGPFRTSLNPGESTSDQYNQDRIWVNGQMIPAAIFSTATDNEALGPHSFPVAGDYVNSGTATDVIDCMNLQQGWNHLVFQFDTSSSARTSNPFKNDELAFKFALNSGFFGNNGTGVICSATAPADLSQAPATGTPEPYISQYSVLSTSPTSIATPFTNETYDPEVYVRLRNNESPATVPMAVISGSQAPLSTGAFTQVRGLDFFNSYATVEREGDLLEGCIAQCVAGANGGVSEPNFTVGTNVTVGLGTVGPDTTSGTSDYTLDFSGMNWTNNMVFKPDCVITTGTPVCFSSGSPLPSSVNANEYKLLCFPYYSQIYYLSPVSGSQGVYEVYSDSACTDPVNIYSNWGTPSGAVSIDIGLTNTGMTPVTILNNWVLNDPDVSCDTDGAQTSDLMTDANENGTPLPAG